MSKRFMGFVLALIVASPPLHSLSNSVEQPTAPNGNQRFLEQLRQQIRGREKEPAGKVFKNVQTMTNVAASQFLVIMDLGFSRGLGVTCTHCHVEQDFSSDDKRAKKAAREMQAFHRGVNQQLAKMEHLESPTNSRAISCSTCHRGQAKPTGE